MADFTLWLEFEHVHGIDDDKRNGYCNVRVHLANGKHYGINVWTFDYFETARKRDVISGENFHGLYKVPPDLFVLELSRDCIEKTISDLLRHGPLEETLSASIVG